MTQYVLFNKERRLYWRGDKGWAYAKVDSSAKRYASMTEALLDAERFQLDGYEAVPVEGKGQNP